MQIMTPAYERDPEEPKVVPKERWFEAPAQGTGGGRGDRHTEGRSDGRKGERSA